jgi:hypothetical protein
VGTAGYISGAQIVTTATIGNFGVSKLTAGTDTAVTTSTGNVLIWNTSTLQSITNRGATTTNTISIANTAVSVSNTTGALTVAGGVGIGGTVYIGPQTTGTINALVYGNTLVSSYTSDPISSTSAVILDAFSTSTYRSAKYFSQATSGTNYVHISEISVFHSGGISYINEYGISTNNGVLGSYDATIANNNLNITFTPISNSTMVVKLTRFTITS